MRALTNDARNVLTETMNIGVGRAAASLSELLGDEVRLEVPALELMENEDLRSHIGRDREHRATGIVQVFSGALSGKAVLLFVDTDALRLVRMLLHDDAPLEQFSEMEREALAEVANILINACIATLSDLLSEAVETAVPRYFDALVDELFETDAQAFQGWLVVRMRFAVAARAINGYMSFVLSSEATDVLCQRLHRGMVNCRG